MREDSTARHLEVLGLPLLLHLAVRVLANKPELIGRLGDNPTALYRHLIDQTTSSAAKWKGQRDLPSESMLPIDDVAFRRDLHQVAVAITTLGGESISFAELGKRSSKNFLEKFRESKGNPYSRLVIGFFFKAGAADAIEFLHKSFREYLFAEAVVDVLLEYGHGAKSDLPQRTNHWQEFDENDPRYVFLRSRLCPMLAAQSLTGEMEDHAVSLISWHLGYLSIHVDRPSQTLTQSQWEAVRDGLADMWDWWGEGVHLRGQPYRDEHDFTRFKAPYIVELVDKSLPQNRYELDVNPTPLRTTGQDSNLGMAIFTLAAAVHRGVAGVQALAEGWALGALVRKYQVSARTPRGQDLRLFAPSGDRADYFLNYVRRIQAAGWRLSKSFTRERDYAGIVLASADLTGLDFAHSRLAYADLRLAILIRADLTSTKNAHLNLSDADLTGAILAGARFNASDLRGSKCTQQQLDETLTGGPTLIPEGLSRPQHW